MRHIVIATLMLLGSAAMADVELIAKNPSITDGDEVIVAAYEQKINEMNQTSDEISAQLFSKKAPAQSNQDGVEVALIKVRH